MNNVTGTYKRAKELVHLLTEKEADCRIEKSENGELVIYTGMVKNKTRFRLAKPEEQMDYIPEQEVIELENNL